jgi:hypothetical protein
VNRIMYLHYAKTPTIRTFGTLEAQICPPNCCYIPRAEFLKNLKMERECNGVEERSDEEVVGSIVKKGGRRGNYLHSKATLKLSICKFNSSFFMGN